MATALDRMHLDGPAGAFLTAIPGGRMTLGNVVVCLLRGSVGLEYGLVSLGLHCFLRLERALCWRTGRCLVGDAFSV